MAGTIADKLRYSADAWDDVQAAINEKGVAVGDDVPRGAYGGKVREIQAGGAPSWDQNVSGLSVKPDGNTVTIRWGDPPSLDWAETVLVRKEGASPTGIDDGEQILVSAVRDQYKATGYADVGAPYDVELWYRLFPRNAEGAVTNNVVNQGSAMLKNYSPVLASNSWDTIAVACAQGLANTLWSVGATKTDTINGASYEFRIIGFNHDNLNSADPKYGTGYNGGNNKAGITFEMVKCYATTYPMNASHTNVGGWDASLMRTSTLPTMLAGLPAPLRDVIRTVSKIASAGNKSTTRITSADKLFLLAEIEVFGTNTFAISGEGSRYSWYSAGNSRVKLRNTSATDWWLRSPDSRYAQYFCTVDSSGALDYNNAGVNYGVSFAFCL